MDEKEELQELHKKLLEMIIDLDSFCNSHGIEYVLAYGNVIGAVRHKGFIPWDDDLDIEMTREHYEKFLSLFKNNEKYYLQKDTADYPLQFSKLRANNTTFIEDIPYKKKYRNIHQGIFIDIFPVDKVACNKICAIKQKIFSNILISQSLYLRGYPKSHLSVKKTVYIFLSFLLLPFRKHFYKYIKSFNNQKDFDYYCSFFASTRKVLHEKRTYIGPFERIQFENLFLPIMNDYTIYLTKVYGDYMKLPSEEEREYCTHAKFFSITEDYKKFLARK